MRKMVVLLAALALAACGEDGTGVEPMAVYEVEIAGGERFRMGLGTQAQVDTAQQLLTSGAEHNISGRVRRGSGGFNSGYSWHLEPSSVHFPDLSMEVCDGRPRSDVEADVDYWVDTVKQYCPWGAKVVARVR